MEKEHSQKLIEKAFDEARAFGQGARRQNNNQQQNPAPNRGNTSSPSAYGPSAFAAPNMPAAPPSPSLATTTTTNDEAYQNNQLPKKLPIFFREDYSGFIVKGNFMTLAARPHLVEEGEWLAHQIAEQNRTLSGMLKIMQEKDRTTGIPTCNDQKCPAMTAGPTTYTWIDTKGNPINLPAPKYINNIQIWVSGKIVDPTLFPTDNFSSAPPLPRAEDVKMDPTHWRGKTSGFPQRFENELKNMYKQMFRCYAHLYWQHWLDFWHLDCNKHLNTNFVHFMNVGRLYNLLNDKDVEPMAPLVELWVKQGVLSEKAVVNANAQPEGAGVKENEASPQSAGGDAAGAGAGGAGATNASA